MKTMNRTKKLAAMIAIAAVMTASCGLAGCGHEAAGTTGNAAAGETQDAACAEDSFAEPCSGNTVLQGNDDTLRHIRGGIVIGVTSRVEEESDISSSDHAREAAPADQSAGTGTHGEPLQSGSHSSAPAAPSATSESSAPAAAPMPQHPAETSPSSPAHVHNWVAQTQTVHHEAVTHTEDQGHYETMTVVDQEVWTEDVIDHYVEQCRCGAQFNTAAELDAHQNWYWENEPDNVQHTSSSVVPVYAPVTHPAVTHEERIWVPNVVTVVDHEAWDENVTTGYVCSSCGATK